MHTNHKGELAALKFQLRAVEKGLTVSKPTTEVRYDFILDEDKKLYRVQVKWAGREPSHAEGSVQIDLRKDGPSGVGKRVYTQDEIDLLLVYVPQIDKMLKFDPHHFHSKKSIIVRWMTPKNGQKTRLTLAENFIW